MGSNDGVRHVMAKRSWWSGRVTALCGWTSESGEYDTRWFSSPSCPTCRRIHREGAR
ncbi:MAG: hypothetical protein ACRDRL_27800 [Sciscionella sp.]